MADTQIRHGEPTYSSLREENDEESKISKRTPGLNNTILLNACLLIVPMLLLTGVLLGLVFCFRLRRSASDDAFSSFHSLDDRNEPNVYYVDFPSTRLIFVASWSSSLSPLLVASIVALWSIRVARQLGQSATTAQRSSLPTPYQLALTLGMLNGSGYSSLYDWIKYSFGWEGHRQKQGSMLTNIGTVLTGGLFLSSFVFVADTWLHFVTKPIDFITSSPSQSDYGYSFILTDECTQGDNSEPWFTANSPGYPCSVVSGASDIWLNNTPIALAALNNVSGTVSVSTYQSDPPYTYISAPSSATARTNFDYISSTFGIETQCHPITSKCNFTQSDVFHTTFNCSDTFHGEMLEDPWQLEYFNDSSMLSTGFANPGYFAWAALVGKNAKHESSSLDSEIIQTFHAGLAFALLCEITVYDVVYTSVNGTVAKFETQISNTSVSNIIAVGMNSINVFDAYLQQATSASIELAANAQDLADSMALSYSKATMALLAASVRAQPAIQAQLWTSSIVSQVPAAPLFMLVAANMSFVVVGLVLLAIILWSPETRRASDVYERLSIFGLVADRFEPSRASRNADSAKELFEEYGGQGSSRVEFVHTSGGGWRYRDRGEL